MFARILLSISLALDASAVAIAQGASKKHLTIFWPLITAFLFGLFQMIFPLVGYIIGAALAKYVKYIDHWVAFLLLGGIGVNMILESSRKQNKQTVRRMRRICAILILSVATSIDALIVGVTFAFIDIPLFSTVLMIGGITMLLSFAGFFVGKKCGELFGRRAELAGGFMLIGIGLNILLRHLFV